MSKGCPDPLLPPPTSHLGRPALTFRPKLLPIGEAPSPPPVPPQIGGVYLSDPRDQHSPFLPADPARPPPGPTPILSSSAFQESSQHKSTCLFVCLSASPSLCLSVSRLLFCFFLIVSFLASEVSKSQGSHSCAPKYLSPSFPPALSTELQTPACICT